MPKTLIAVSSSTMSEYVENQIQAIKNLYPDLETQHVNETDPIMERHARYPGRLPAFFIIKNGAVMSSLQAKVTTQQILDWFTSTSG
jgi:hypothetical protein